MNKENDSRFASIEDCIEECYIASKLCYDKADGTQVCPFDYQKCVEDCQKRFSSQTTGIQ